MEVLNAKRQRGGSIVNVDNCLFNMKIPAFAKMNQGTSLRIFRSIFLRNIGTVKRVNPSRSLKPPKLPA